MKMRRVAMLLAAAAAFVGTAARADCTMPSLDPSVVFCKGCSYDSTISMPRNQVCERSYSPGTLPNSVELFSNRIVQRAKNGMAGVTNDALFYVPKKGFTGDDEFVVEANYRAPKETGKFTVRFRVTVK